MKVNTNNIRVFGYLVFLKRNYFQTKTGRICQQQTQNKVNTEGSFSGRRKIIPKGIRKLRSNGKQSKSKQKCGQM